MRPYVWATVTSRQVSLRIGARTLGIRTAAARTVLTGWRIARLPFGLVAFYRKDPVA